MRNRGRREKRRPREKRSRPPDGSATSGPLLITPAAGCNGRKNSRHRDASTYSWQAEVGRHEWSPDEGRSWRKKMRTHCHERSPIEGPSWGKRKKKERSLRDDKEKEAKQRNPSPCRDARKTSGLERQLHFCLRVRRPSKESHRRGIRRPSPNPGAQAGEASLNLKSLNCMGPPAKMADTSVLRGRRPSARSHRRGIRRTPCSRRHLGGDSDSHPSPHPSYPPPRS